jgi:hypothetical protein
LAQIQWKFPEPLQVLHDYWRLKRSEKGKGLPRFADIDVASIPLVAPHLLLLDVIAAGEDFRYRHIGPGLSQAVGTDFTGRRMSEAIKPGPYLDYVLGFNREVVRERRPLFAESSFRGQNLAMRWTSRLVLPLVVGRDAVDMIIAAQVFGGVALGRPVPPYAKSGEFEEGVRILLD